ncbi:MAG: carboxylesterase family protein [Acetobacteraceae bacterium]|nr:carboxylesterase family protein [Acetobacteraceae bacterium]
MRSQRRLLRDNWYGWPVWTWARLQSKTGSGKVYFYQFSHVTRFPKNSPMSGMGAAHGFELIYTFGHTDYLPNTATAEDRQMVSTLSSYWTNFAKNGDPNGPGLPKWPKQTKKDGYEVMHLTQGSSDTVHAAPSTVRARYELLERLAAEPAPTSTASR